MKNKDLSFKFLVIILFLNVLVLIHQLLLKHYNMILILLFSSLILVIPRILQKKFHIIFPNHLKILFYLLIFLSGIMGEIYHFYINITWWDIVLHVLNGLMWALVGKYLLYQLNKEDKLLNIFFNILFICSFSMASGIFWEFQEYFLDKVFLFDGQKDTLLKEISSIDIDTSKNYKPVIIKDINKTVLLDSDDKILTIINGGYLDIGLNDTMIDLLAFLLGSFIYSLCYYFSFQNNKFKTI